MILLHLLSPIFQTVHPQFAVETLRVDPVLPFHLAVVPRRCDPYSVVLHMRPIKLGIDNGNYNTKSSDRIQYASGFTVQDAEFITSDMPLSSRHTFDGHDLTADHCYCVRNTVIPDIMRSNSFHSIQYSLAICYYIFICDPKISGECGFKTFF